MKKLYKNNNVVKNTIQTFGCGCRDHTTCEKTGNPNSAAFVAGSYDVRKQ